MHLELALTCCFLLWKLQTCFGLALVKPAFEGFWMSGGSCVAVVSIKDMKGIDGCCYHAIFWH